MTTFRAVRGQVKGLALGSDFVGKRIGDEFHFETYANKPVVDRFGEIVDATAFKGSLATYQRNPIMLFMHNPMWAIGRFPSVELRPDGLFVRGVIGHGFEPADTARLQVEQGILRGLSIGFRETQKGKVDGDGIYHITGLDLLEISLVSIPACQEAVFQFSENDELAEVVLVPDEHEEIAAMRKMAHVRRFFSVPNELSFSFPTDEEKADSIYRFAVDPTRWRAAVTEESSQDATSNGTGDSLAVDPNPLVDSGVPESAPLSEPAIDFDALGTAAALAGETGQLTDTVTQLTERISQLEAQQARLDDVELAVSIMLETQLSNLAAAEGTSVAALTNPDSITSLNS